MVDSGGTQQQYRYDAAGRLAQVLSSGGATLATYSYGAGNQRLMSVEGGVTTCYGWDGGQVIAEYEPSGASGLLWKTGYVYLGGRLLATTNAGGTRFHHPDRLGTNVVTDQSNVELVTKQMGLPYGTQQPSGAFGGDNSWQHSSKTNPSRKRFTSYDRSAATGLDYAVNRHYSSPQGRFTQVDPIGMSAVSLGDPQSLNLYAYCGNDPVNRLDPDGLFWGKLFGWIGKVVKWVAIAVTVAIAVLTVIPAAWAGVALGKLLVFLAAHKTIAGILGLGGITGSFGTPSTFPKGSGVGGVTRFFQDPVAMKAVPPENSSWLRLFVEWALGIGPEIRQFGPNSDMTRDLYTSPDIDRHRRRYCQDGKPVYRGSFRFGVIGWAKGANVWGLRTKAADGLIRANTHMGRQFVGSFTLTITRQSDGSALFEAYNETSIQSFLAGIVPLSVSRNQGSILELPGSTTKQFYWWREASPCGDSMRAR